MRLLQVVKYSAFVIQVQCICFLLFLCVSINSLHAEYRYCSISVELRRWSGDGALFTRLDKYRVFFHTSNC